MYNDDYIYLITILKVYHFIVAIVKRLRHAIEKFNS